MTFQEQRSLKTKAMGVDLLVIGNHKVNFIDPEEIIEIVGAIPADSGLKNYGRQIQELYPERKLPTRDQDYQLVPYYGRDYESIPDLYQKEGCVYFKGYMIEQLIISPELLHLYPGFRWDYYWSCYDLFRAIRGLARSVLSRLGCNEFIFMPDSLNISSYLLGDVDTSGQFFKTKRLPDTPLTNSLFQNVIYDLHHPFEDIKDKLAQYLGPPATSYRELVANNDFNYLIDMM